MQTNDHAPSKRGRMLLIASYLLLLLIALPLRVANLGAFLSGDEADFWLPRSERFLQAIQSGDLADTAITTHPGVTTMWCGTAGIALRRFLFENHILQQETFPLLLALHRLPLALVHTAALLVGYALLRRMFAPTLALFAALLWATDPFVLAFSRVLHVDGPATTFATLCLLAACLYWNHMRQFRWLLLSAIFAGLAIVSKSPAFLLLPTVGMLALWATWQDTRQSGQGRTQRRKAAKDRAGDERLPTESPGEKGPSQHPPPKPLSPRARGFRLMLRAALLPLVVWGVLCGITMALVWPAVLIDPLRVIELFRVGVEVEGGSPHMLGNFFLGQHTDVPGPMFYPVALAMRTTPVTLIGLLLLPIAMFISQRTTRATTTTPTQATRDTTTMRDLTVLAGWILLFTLAMSIFPKKFNRYLVPVFPALDILAAVGLVGMVQMVIGSRRDRAGPRAKAQSRKEPGRASRKGAKPQRDGQEMGLLNSHQGEGERTPFPPGDSDGKVRPTPGSAGGSPAPGRGLAVPNPYLITNPPVTIRVPGGGRGQGMGELQSTIVLLLLALASTLNAIWYHPYNIVYFNQLLGGAQAGAETFVVGWGEGYEQVAAFINQQPDSTGVATLSKWGSSLNAYLKPGAQANSADGQAIPDATGYVVVYIRHVLGGQPPSPPYDRFYGNMPPLHVVKLGGVEYAWIYHWQPPPQEPLQATFGSAIHLSGYTLDTAALTSSNTLTLTLQWQAQAPLATDYKLFVHVLDTAGQRVGQIDVAPGGVAAPTSTWEPGRFRTRHYPITLQQPVAQGEPYWIALGLYNPADGGRLPLRAPPPRGAPDAGPDALFLGPVVLRGE